MLMIAANGLRTNLSCVWTIRPRARGCVGTAVQIYNGDTPFVKFSGGFLTVLYKKLPIFV